MSNLQVSVFGVSSNFFCGCSTNLATFFIHLEKLHKIYHMTESVLPVLGSVAVGGFFIAAGIEKIADPAAMASVIKHTKFYDLAVRNHFPLNKGHNLHNFTVAIGSSLVIAGALFMFNIQRRLASGCLSFLLASHAIFVHLNLDNLSKTSKTDVVSAFQQFALVGALWIIGFGKRVIEVRARPPTVVSPIVTKEEYVAVV